MSPLAYALIQSDWCPYSQKRMEHTDAYTQVCIEKKQWRHEENCTTCKPKREASEEIKCANTFILDCYPSELWKN